MQGRVAIVTEIAAPYRIPVFAALDRMLGGRLEVIFISESESRRDWEIRREEFPFSSRVLGGLQFSVPYRGDRQPVYVARPLLPLLLRERYDVVVVGGWNHLESLWTLLDRRVRSSRLVLWAETPLLGPLPRRPLRSAWKRTVIAAADAYAVPGPSAGRYLVAHGASEERIHVAPNAVDVDFWSVSPPARAVNAGSTTLLYSGRLVPNKGLDVALEAFGRSRLAGSARFLVAGDGPERERLRRLASPGVEFLGPQQPVPLRELYHRADLLVFPSRYDPWGLVLNEASCAGLAAVASDGAGATRDLIVDGENGIVVPAGDVAGLTSAFNRVADEPALPARLGERVRAVADTHSPEQCAAGLARAIG